MAQPDESVPGYFVEGDDGDDEGEFCWEHAEARARYVARFNAAGKRRRRKVEAYIGRLDGESDGSRRCARETCGVRLAVSLTDYGVESALGLTEEDPLDCCIDVRDLVEAAGTMSQDDERYGLWYWHFQRLRSQPSKPGDAGDGHDQGDEDEGRDTDAASLAFFRSWDLEHGAAA